MEKYLLKYDDETTLAEVATRCIVIVVLTVDLLLGDCVKALNVPELMVTVNVSTNVPPPISLDMAGTSCVTVGVMELSNVVVVAVVDWIAVPLSVSLYETVTEQDHEETDTTLDGVKATMTVKPRFPMVNVPDGNPVMVRVALDVCGVPGTLCEVTESDDTGVNNPSV